jgi:hypothetical protein
MMPARRFGAAPAWFPAEQQGPYRRTVYESAT